MRDLFVYLFWGWCLVSVVILVYRRVGKPSSTSDAHASVDDAVAAAQLPAPSSDVSAAAGPGAVRPRELASLGGPGIAAPSPPPPPPPPPPPARDEADVAPAQDEPEVPSPVAAMAAGVPLSTVDDLATAMAGIQLPCNLAPLMGTGDIDPRELVLTTSDHPPQIVGTSVGDELERLGFEFTPLSETSLLAQRDGAAVELSLFTSATAHDDRGNRRFPTAPDNSVVVQLRLR